MCLSGLIPTNLAVEFEFFKVNFKNILILVADVFALAELVYQVFYAPALALTGLEVPLLNKVDELGERFLEPRVCGLENLAHESTLSCEQAADLLNGVEGAIVSDGLVVYILGEGGCLNDVHLASFLLFELLVQARQIGEGDGKNTLGDPLHIVQFNYFLEVLQTFGVLFEAKGHQRHVIQEVSVGSRHALRFPHPEGPRSKPIELREDDRIARKILVSGHRENLYDPPVQSFEHDERSFLAQTQQLNRFVLVLPQKLHQF